MAGPGEVEAHATGLERQQEQLGAAGVILEAIDHRLALVFAGAAIEKRHLLAPLALQVGLEQVTPFGELGEQQGPIPRLDHLFENFLEPLHLGAAAGKASGAMGGSVGVFLEGEGGMVADLLELGEQGQHLAVFLTEGRAGNRIEAGFDRLVVELFLLGAEAHPFAQFHLLGQVGNDRFVGLEPAQDEGPHPGLEVAQGGHIAIALNGQAIALAEERFIAQHLGIEEIHQGPELADAVFHRGTREGNPKTAELAGPGQIPGGHGLLGGGGLDGLGFINHHPLPINAFQQLAIALQQAIAGEHQIHAFQGFFERFWAGGPPRAVVLAHAEFGGEARRFPFPVGEDGGGCHQQHRPFEFVFGLEVLQEGQQLDRFAQAHVIGQAGPLIKAVQEGEPAQAPLLVGPQLAGEAFGCG